MVNGLVLSTFLLFLSTQSGLWHPPTPFLVTVYFMPKQEGGG